MQQHFSTKNLLNNNLTLQQQQQMNPYFHIPVFKVKTTTRKSQADTNQKLDKRHTRTKPQFSLSVRKTHYNKI